MRRAAYIFHSKSYQDIFIRFCNIESIMPIDMSQNADKSSAYVLFITDDKEELEKYISANTPKCLVSSDRSLNSYSYISNECCYTINENFGLYSLRILFDLVHHGSILQNSTGSLHFTTNVKECYAENSIDDIERFVFFMTQELLYFVPFGEAEKIRIGFSEMIINAIEHGNFAITNREKFEHTEAGTYQELLAERGQDLRYKDRKVYIRMALDVDKVVITIRDEGDGFDITKLPSPKADDQLMKLHGRGILITRVYFDEVRYNAKGNEVNLVKKLNKVNF